MASKAIEATVDAPVEVQAVEHPEGEGEHSARAAIDAGLTTMAAHFAAQKRVRVRVPEDTWVQVNGYTFLIKGKTPVEVPEQVAEILADAGRI